MHWLRRLPASVRARTQTALVALRARVMLATNRQLPEDLRWYGYLKSLGPAMRAYRYRPLNCRASFLYGPMDDDTFKIWKDCWEALVPGGAEIKSFENIHDHNEFMVDPGMTYLVEYLERDSKPG